MTSALNYRSTSIALVGLIATLTIVIFAHTAPVAAQTGELKVGEIFRDCPDCPEMVVIPAGKFKMGSNRGRTNEKPVREVMIAKAFSMSVAEITFNQWEVCVQSGVCSTPDDHRWGRSRRPVINITWGEANTFIKFLRKRTGKIYRMPTEAEWEYAARAGTRTRYWWGNKPGKNRANCRKCGTEFHKRSAPVKSFKANAFGLYDMNGNVWEWVQDCFWQDYAGAPVDGAPREGDDCRRRTVRGGSWYYIAKLMTSAYRTSFPPSNASYNIGIRLVRELP